MSNQPENEKQQPLTPKEVRQFLLAELDASKQVIAELSDEELAEIQGGSATELLGIMIRDNDRYAHANGILRRTQSADGRIESAPFRLLPPSGWGRSYSSSSAGSEFEMGLASKRVQPVNSPTHEAAHNHPHHP